MQSFASESKQSSPVANDQSTPTSKGQVPNFQEYCQRLTSNSDVQKLLSGLSAIGTESVLLDHTYLDNKNRDLAKWADGSIGSAWRIWNPFCYLFNLTMQPAASLPCGFTAKGLPVGLQVVGRMHDDLTVLRACAALEPHVSPLKLAPRPN